jgi:hypothetical protein
MTRRIIQFSTGNVGVHALRTIIERPDLELVGLHAANPDKIGRDAAELCGLAEPTGVIATDDVDALLALEADCVVYTSQAETRAAEAMEDIAGLPRGQFDVVHQRDRSRILRRHARLRGAEPRRACRIHHGAGDL